MMKMFSLRFPMEIYEKIQEISKKENRSMNNKFLCIAKEYIEKNGSFKINK